MALGESTMLLAITVLVFGCGALLAVAASRSLNYRESVRRRLASVPIAGSAASDAPGSSDLAWHNIDPDRLGLDPAAQRLLQAELIRAGFFAPNAVAAFGVIRLALLVALPLLGTLVLSLAFPAIGATEKVAVAATLLAVAYYLPRAYLSRRQRTLENAYRLTFPDFLDMLVVCINAGLSLEAALDRVGRELGGRDAAFRANLDLMAGEMRAGKSTGEALRALSDRLTLPEARSFAALLLQTIELGTDVAQALSIFSDEMRDKRMSRAEEKASALPPKLTLPLGLFIFPVVLIAVLAPAVLKIIRAVGP